MRKQQSWFIRVIGFAIVQALGAADSNAQTAARGASASDAAPAASETADPLAEVVVSGLRASLESARELKRDSASITDSVVAQDIGKLPDQNIAEAAQRIPGVQLQRFEGEGASIAIRGLKQNKVVLNGREVFGSSAHNGEYNGRTFDLEDLPSEVLAGIDISKTSSANEIEGGLGGYVNIRTRQPFDFSGSQATVSAKATQFDLAPGFKSKVKGQGSVLLSGRTQTDLGEMGLLANIGLSEGVFGIAENEIQRTQETANYAGSGQTVISPIGMFTGNGHHGTRKRESYNLAYQWQPSDSLLVNANFMDIHYFLKRDFQTARVNFGTPTGAFSLWPDSSNLQSGTFTGNSITDTSVLGDEGRDSKLYSIGAQWDATDALAFKADVSRNQTEVVNTLFEWGLNVAVPTASININSGSASHVSIGGVDLANKANYTPNYLLAINLNGTQEETAAVLEGAYKFDTAFLKSVDFGVRYSDYTRDSFGFVDFYCVDGCGNTRTLATVDPSLLHQVPGRESRDIGSYWTFDSAAVREQFALRALYGLPAAEGNADAFSQLNEEKTKAAFVKANYGWMVGAVPVNGNLGVRFLKTDLHGESYGTDPVTGASQLQAKDTSRNDVLPSLNIKAELRENIVLRGGASKTLGQVNFQYLSAATVISNQVQHDAQRGNPDLKPYTSKNIDVSLEDYFSDNGMAYLGLFHKSVEGFVQTVALQETINGELYNVSTYASAGTSTIKGLEIGFHKFFDRLPAPFDGFGVQANYTYVDSESPSAVAGKTVPLEGLSKNSYNVIAMYEKGRVKARLAYNFRSEFVVSTSSSGAQGVPILADSLGTLDFSTGYDFGDKLSLVFDAVNILGADSEQYYGSSQNQMNYLPLVKTYGVQVRYTF